MLGLPKSTEFSKQLPKKAIYEKFNMEKEERDDFDADVSRINIVASISPSTVSIAQGETVSAVYVLQVFLKHKAFENRTISKINKLIDQNMVLALDCDGERKLAIQHTKLWQTEWMSPESCSVRLIGLNLDTVWANLVAQIGGFKIEPGNSLDEQIAANEQKAKLEKEIARLEKQARNEKQPKKKFELVQQIKKLRGGNGNG